MTANGREYDAAYREAHRDEIRLQNAANQRARRERRRAAGLPTQTDADRAYSKAHYAADPGAAKAAAVEWRRQDARRRVAQDANTKAKRLGVGGRLDWRELPALPGPCTYCGNDAGGIDHVMPMGKGGPNVLSNVVRCCRSCNERKNDGPVSRVAVA